MVCTTLPAYWSSKIPKRHKRNRYWEIYIDLIACSNFSEVIKFEKTDYPKRFINVVIRQFQDKSTFNIDDFHDYFIPPNYFIPKSFISIELLFGESNQIKSKRFLKMFHRFTKDRFEVAIKWKTRQATTLLPFKYKSIHPSFVTYLFLWKNLHRRDYMQCSSKIGRTQ